MRYEVERRYIVVASFDADSGEEAIGMMDSYMGNADPTEAEGYVGFEDAVHAVGPGSAVPAPIDVRDVIARGRPSGDYGAHERVPGCIEYTDWYAYDGMDVLVAVEFTRGDWDSRELEDLPWDTAPAAVMGVITGNEEAD